MADATAGPATGYMDRLTPFNAVVASFSAWLLVFVLSPVEPRWAEDPTGYMLALLGVGWVAWSGFSGITDVLTFRGATGWDIESSVGSAWHLLEPASKRLESGAVRVGHSIPLLSVAMFVVSMPVAAWAIWRGAHTRRIGTGWVAGLGAILCCSALLSPQFLGWLLPAAAIAWATRSTSSPVAPALTAMFLA